MPALGWERSGFRMQKVEICGVDTTGLPKLTAKENEELMKELELEWAREFQSEGQRFYCYKRLNLPIYQGEGKAAYDYDAIDCWVLQQPLQEDSYNSL